MERLVSEMTYYVSSGMLNPTHSLTHSLKYCRSLFALVLVLKYSQSQSVSTYTNVTAPIGWSHSTLCLKNNTDVAHYNFDALQIDQFELFLAE